MDRIFRYMAAAALTLLLLACSRPAFEGIYLDQDNDEPNLFITKQDDGSYRVEVGIFRLTFLDDGIGTADRHGLSFTATDACGEPIGGVITLQADTATVTFTSSNWELIENGSTFKYVREDERHAILRHVRSIYDDVAMHPFDTDRLTEKYCSRAWKQKAAKALASEDTIDSNYWVQGQDAGEIYISDLTLADSDGKLTDGRCAVSFRLHNLGTEIPMKLILVRENGQWVIDDFIPQK